MKDELIDVWDKSVRSSHHFLKKEDLEYYCPRIRDIYFDAVDLYVIRNPRVSAFMGLSEDMVEMLFVLPFEKGKGYGSALLNFAFGEKDIRKIDVNEQNTEAYQFLSTEAIRRKRGMKWMLTESLIRLFTWRDKEII